MTAEHTAAEQAFAKAVAAAVLAGLRLLRPAPALDAAPEAAPPDTAAPASSPEPIVVDAAPSLHSSSVDKGAWTPERRALLRSLKAEGCKISSIADRLNGLPGPLLHKKSVENQWYRFEKTIAAGSIPQVQAPAPVVPRAAVPVAPRAPVPVVPPAEVVAQPAPGPAVAATPAAPSGKARPASREAIRGFVASKAWSIDPADLKAVNAKCRSLGIAEFVLR